MRREFVPEHVHSKLGEEFDDFKMTPDMTVVEYYHKFNEKSRYVEDIGLNQESLALRFEKGLTYKIMGDVIGYLVKDLLNLLLQEPLPSLNKAYSTLIQEEGVRGRTNERVAGARDGKNRAEPVGFAAQYNSVPVAVNRMEEDKKKEGETTRPYYDGCNKFGHTHARCFDIIGYPKGWRDRTRGGGRGGRGNSRGGGRGAGNSARVNDSAESQEEYVTVLKEKWEAFVNHSKGSTSNTRMNGKTEFEIFWLLDSGATHHMTGCYDLLENLQEIEPCMITLPNGKHARATKKGSAKLFDDLILTNMLFVPDFHRNLVSVFQLMLELNCTVNFTNDNSVLQDRVSMKIIGKGEQRGRLYSLRGAVKPRVMACRKEGNDGNLWHLRHPRKDGDKFESRSRRCILVGFPFGRKGWEVYDLDTKQFFVSRDVVFDELIFPYRVDNMDNTTHKHDLFDVDDDAEFILTDVDVDPHVERVVERAEETGVADREAAAPGNAIGQLTQQAEEVEYGRGKRAHIPWSRYSDDEYVTVGGRVISNTEKYSSSPSDLMPSSASGAPYSLTHFISSDKFSVRHRSFVAAIDGNVEPRSFREAMKDNHWCDAMNHEIEALIRNGTWEIVDLPKGKKAIGNKWVYKVKLKADGSVVRFKARLVVLGNRQEEGVDFFETFASTAKMVTVRTFLALAASKRWELHQMDVHNAFLHGDLEE
ncbi:uncharacterized protein LOC141630360 [Silene latifolia]|uniref:uncharacterized protein LOC141630360 n=1 Tax=Silene latifolia TaxID=37657 RepID=UPI003D779057